MRNPYSEIFRAPGTKSFAAAAFIARLPIAMAPIGIVAMLSQTHGEYWLAGAVSATYALVNAFLSPQVSRLVDRLGQSRIAVPTTLVSALAFATLIVAANQHWPVWTLFLSSLLAALMPSIPALVRARWTEIFRNRPELNTAFAFESAADDLVYVAGASLSVGLSAALFPEAGMVVSTLLLAFGSAAFLLQRSTEPPIRPAEDGAAGSAIRLRPVQIITFALIFVGATFATTEVTTVAITEELGQPEAASLVIGVYALGSFVLGIIVGALSLRTPLQRQLAIAVAVIALTTLPLLFADTVPTLALAVFVSGVAISPTFITAFGLIERHVPPAMLTEGVTWVTTGIGIGIALGSFAAGWMVDTFGPQNGFWVSVAAGSVALVTVLAGQCRLATPDCDPNECEAAIVPAG
ncbi:MULTISPECIES: MFS transporter [unclassified Mesorhizobium]|uniref:MFS transporter n=1 Tax=unclassified Mesorhizobium TaxID=325217 RepID=UPI002416C8C4|nr:MULTISPECIES: MFS transporter [unclassified Mesorhizobium]MDG4900385.1 MFS transporter [Mesorhizobium sp. WSM4962]MDG4917380.1 MFS transporter [Mesorhizobium sp. WSM4989]